MKLLTLKFPATCADKSCGAALPAGTRAKWYGRGRVYGLACHERKPALPCETCGGLPCLEGCDATAERRGVTYAHDPIARRFSETTGDYLRDPGEDAEDRWNETHA